MLQIADQEDSEQLAHGALSQLLLQIFSQFDILIPFFSYVWLLVSCLFF